MVADLPPAASTVPRFTRELALPDGPEEAFLAAATAIKHEHRASSEWKQFRCVQVIAVDRAEGLYRIDTGVELGLDGWEGSTAARPVERGSTPDAGDEDGDRSVWSGAVVEADDAQGSLYVAVEHGRAPCLGTFYVRPFEFTAMLNRIYNGPEFASLRPLLRARLRACEQGADLRPTLRDPWPVGWNLLWGPPGTGKTRFIGERVAQLLQDGTERTLVVSTTNDATDAVALSVGRARPHFQSSGSPIVRVGRGARYRRYEEARLQHLLQTREHQLRTQIEDVRSQLEGERRTAERARLRKLLEAQVRELRGAATAAVKDAGRRVLVTTAFHALTFVAERNMLDESVAPFTTVIIDEAGLLSRATLAALSLLASRRVVLVGDPKQLAPISRMSRVLPSEQGRWLGLSALHHLDLGATGPGREFLAQQYRMHPEIRRVVSAYQYGGRLEDAEGIKATAAGLPARRAIWYVLDEDKCERHQLRAERGPFNRSWVRGHTREVLERFFSTHPQTKEMVGRFLSPFVGQCREISRYLAERSLGAWKASTVHQQQGAEADVVIFDTVNAGSTCWPSDEWERLINVAISRARSQFLLLATRDEMSQPFLAPLVEHLWPAAFKYAGRAWSLEEVDRVPARIVASKFEDTDPRLGAQLARRRALRPILSAEQQRLCQFEMDGKARLVRGVAGSGKTVVLANWLVQTYLKLRAKSPRLWVVFANAALEGLITRTIDDAWERNAQSGRFPREAIVLHHIDSLLANLERPRSVPHDLRFEYDRRAVLLLGRGKTLTPSCDAMFLDEAQDLGPTTIRLLAQLVKQSDPEDPKSRAINIFYDNAQNVYGRGTPKWIDLGLDIRGRSVVMKESFRSTKPIAEFALNVLARLTAFDEDNDQREYIERGLVERSERDGKPWWVVHFNEISGPVPRFKRFTDRQREIEDLCRHVKGWIIDEQVSPSDIVVVTMGKVHGQNFGEVVASALSRSLAEIGVRSDYRTGEGFLRDGRTVVVTTPHSFKGYEAELVYVVGVDRFATETTALPAPLYVALTRARSVLVASGTTTGSQGSAKILAVFKEVGDLAGAAPAVHDQSLPKVGVADYVRSALGPEYEGWLDELVASHELTVDVLTSSNGEVIAEPMFVARTEGVQVAFYKPDAQPSRQERFRLEDAGYKVGLVGVPLITGKPA